MTSWVAYKNKDPASTATSLLFDDAQWEEILSDTTKEPTDRVPWHVFESNNDLLIQRGTRYFRCQRVASQRVWDTLTTLKPADPNQTGDVVSVDGVNWVEIVKDPNVDAHDGVIAALFDDNDDILVGRGNVAVRCRLR